MKNVIILLLCVLVVPAVFGQAVDLDKVELSALEFSQADLSNARFYFAGPVDLLLRGIVYEGTEYAALLKYDGEGGVEIAAPSSPSAAGLPYALDLSEVRLSLANDGVRVTNVIANGYYFSGKLVPTPDKNLAVAPGVTMGRLAGTEDLTEDAIEFRAELRDLRTQLAALEADKQELEDELADTKGELAATEDDLSEAEDRFADANARLSEARSQLSQTRTQISSLETRLRRTAGDPLAPAAAVTRVLRADLADGTSARGSWSMSGTGLRQSASRELFAKYVLPVRQNADELVYSFRGTGAAEGWSGYGFHILSSGSRENNLYGFGSSYLVWVTRDPARTQSDQTFVQLYRSYDDVHMVQLASRAIDHPISSPLDVTVYANRTDRTIVIGVDDEAVLTFEDPDMIRSGSHVVARTLGSATLSALSVKSR